MQDRFKFRIWDKEQNKYFSFEDFKRFDVEFNFDPTTNEVVCEYDKNRYIVLSSTGLKDKNGKLIYEGDVLDLYVSSKKLYRYEVKYEIGSFMLVSQDEIFDFPNVWNDYVYPLSQLYYEYQNEENCIDECEVIGNIYENPELLEQL